VIRRLKALATLITECHSDALLPVVGMEHVESGTGRIAWSSVPVGTAPDAGTAAVRPGDILFGKLRPYLAKYWLANRSIFASTELMCLRPLGGTDSAWLRYLCASQMVLDWAVATSEGTKMPRTSWERLRELKVDVPSLSDQIRIACYLDRETKRIDALIVAKRELREILEGRYWNWLVYQATSLGGRLVPLRRLISFISDGPFGSAFSSADYTDAGAAVVRLGNIGFAKYRQEDQAYISMDQYQSFLRYRVAPGDLLIAGLGDARNHPGRACVSPAELGPAMVKGKCFVARVRPELTVADYLAVILSSPYGAEIMNIAARGSTRTMINLEIVKDVEIPVPSLSEQDDIVRRAQNMRQSLELATSQMAQQLDLLAEHRRALITAAVTGEFDVTGSAA
jgi:type I restriction enzyme S subunit